LQCCPEPPAIDLELSRYSLDFVSVSGFFFFGNKRILKNKFLFFGLFFQVLLHRRLVLFVVIIEQKGHLFCSRSSLFKSSVKTYILVTNIVKPTPSVLLDHVTYFLSTFSSVLLDGPPELLKSSTEDQPLVKSEK
jgi:hypothetical protein